MFLEKNLQALSASGSYDCMAVIEAILASPAATDVEIFETDAGDLTLKYKGVFIHDPKGAVAEAKAIVEEHCSDENDMYQLVLGIGLGYVLQQAVEVSKGRILVYETDVPFLRFVLENVDLSAYLANSNVCLLTEQYQIIHFLRPRLIFGDQLDMLVLRSYAYLMADQVNGLMDSLYNLAQDRQMDYNTVCRFHFQWMEQFFSNMQYFPDTLPMERLKGLGKGKPAMVVSRGPSLDGAIADLKEMADSVVIVAVGGAVRRLYQEGITPDFAVFYDARGMQEQMNGIPEEFWSQISFLLCPFTQDVTFEHPARDRFVFFGDNNPQYASWVDEIFGRHHTRLEGGGTVSLIALQAAMMLDCNPIALVGQDLAFQNNCFYAGGIQIQQDANGRVTLEASDELFSEAYPTMKVQGQNREEMLTTKAFAAFIRHFEQIAGANQRSKMPRRLINASIGGAHIEGYELLPLSELRQQMALDHFKPGHFLDPHTDLTQSEAEKVRATYAKGIDQLEKSVNALLKLLPNLAETARKNASGPSNSANLALVRGTIQTFKREIDRSPFVRHFVLTATLEHFRKVKSGRRAEDPAAAIMKADAEYLKNVEEILREKIKPWLSQTKDNLRQGALAGSEKTGAQV